MLTGTSSCPSVNGGATIPELGRSSCRLLRSSSLRFFQRGGVSYLNPLRCYLCISEALSCYGPIYLHLLLCVGGSCAVHSYSEAMTANLRSSFGTNDLAVDLPRLLHLAIAKGFLTARGASLMDMDDLVASYGLRDPARWRHLSPPRRPALPAPGPRRRCLRTG